MSTKDQLREVLVAPQLVRAAARDWDLTLVEPLAGDTSSRVWAVRDADGRELVSSCPARRPTRTG